jgi:hypothetical protein
MTALTVLKDIQAGALLLAGILLLVVVGLLLGIAGAVVIQHMVRWLRGGEMILGLRPDLRPGAEARGASGIVKTAAQGLLPSSEGGALFR